MENINLFFYAIMGIWFVSEILYKRLLASGKTDQKDKDKSTLNMLWVVIILSILMAQVVRVNLIFPITDSIFIYYVGAFLVTLGIVLRFFIIRNLGKYFTVDVTIRENHQIKKDGFYKLVRHPSYAASLLTFLGFGLYLNNWLSLIVAFLPAFFAFSYRILIEEKALIQQFGQAYLDYRKSTYKLIPYIY